MTEQTRADSGLIPGVPPPAFTQRPMDATARAIAAHDRVILETITNYLPGAIASALAAQRHTCSNCLLRKCRWEVANPGLLDTAFLAACAARDIDPDDAEARQQVQFSEAFEHMPEELRHDPDDPWNPTRMPLMYKSTMTVGGTDLCDHCATELFEQRIAQEAAQAAHAANLARAAEQENTGQPATTRRSVYRALTFGFAGDGTGFAH